MDRIWLLPPVGRVDNDWIFICQWTNHLNKSIPSLCVFKHEIGSDSLLFHVTSVFHWQLFFCSQEFSFKSLGITQGFLSGTKKHGWKRLQSFLITPLLKAKGKMYNLAAFMCSSEVPVNLQSDVTHTHTHTHTQTHTQTHTRSSAIHKSQCNSGLWLRCCGWMFLAAEKTRLWKRVNMIQLSEILFYSSSS